MKESISFQQDVALQCPTMQPFVTEQHQRFYTGRQVVTQHSTKIDFQKKE